MTEPKESQAAPSPASLSQAFYTCRKCGTQLFTHDTVLHEPSSASSARTPQPERSPSASDNGSAHAAPDTMVSKVKTPWGLTAAAHGDYRAVCRSVFLSEAPLWASDVAANEGRFACPNCTSRVGSYAWSGATCSCGRWITPAFQFQLSRVDARRAVPLTDYVVARPGQPQLTG